MSTNKFKNGKTTTANVFDSGLIRVHPFSIRLIVPFPAGGGAAGVVRNAFQRSPELAGQQVVIVSVQ
ncbi:MAG TPA: hypothetical protein VK663_04190 [Burkholderiales bacterium]|nr:hypothetical protein [Burkholderiales bacterium]